MIWKRSSN